jgi:glycosyltransferase involved in cell wall biosynthesis
VTFAAGVSRRIRVFMTTDTVGGVWRYCVDLAGSLRRYGVETILATIGPNPSPDQVAAVDETGAHLFTTGLPLDWTAGSTAEVERAGRDLALAARRFAPDLVHLNSAAFAAPAEFPAPVVSVAHSCVATWWEAVRGSPLPDDFEWRTDLVRRGYQASAAVVAPSAAFASATARTYAMEGDPAVVWNGRRAPRPDHRSVAPAQHAFTAGRLWDEGKNIAALDRAAARMRIPILAAGPVEGPNGVVVRPSRIRLLGTLDEHGIAAQLRMRPVYVSAAKYEPFGLAVLEAAQAGCALVLSDIATLRELWDEAALFVPAEDDRAIAEAVQMLLGNPDARARLAQAAHERSRTYRVDRMARGMLAVYGSVAGGGAVTRTVVGGAAA